MEDIHSKPQDEWNEINNLIKIKLQALHDKSIYTHPQDN